MTETLDQKGNIPIERPSRQHVPAQHAANQSVEEDGEEDPQTTMTKRDLPAVPSAPPV